MRDSVEMVHDGVHSLVRNGSPSRRFSSSSLLLATGLERLIKMVLVLDDVHNNRPLSQGYFRHQLNHDLQKGFEAIASRGLWSPADSDPAVWEDGNVCRVVEILKDCSGVDRYAYFDPLFTTAETLDTPERFYARFLSDLESQLPGSPEAWANQDHAKINQLIEQSRTMGVAVIQRLARALCRIFTLGPIAGTSKVFTSYLSPFLYLRDEELGTPRPLPNYT
ncbi:MAG: hypothetical protein KIS61_30130 [Candidatus Eremiobacteraeota bacterium]|nr:hypothetical protein [Candidatus Eremiobacteraeota bacterium]